MTPDPAPWECPRCHCLFERPGFGHEPCGDPVSVTLAEAKRIADTLAFACRIPDKVPDFTACGGPAAEAYWAYFTPARIVSLLAAIEAVLKLAGDWDNESVRLDAVAARSFPGGDRGVIAAARAGVFQGCAEALREAITSALTGAQPEASDG